jgi:hypothetical protein
MEELKSEMSKSAESQSLSDHIYEEEANATD